MHAWTLLSLRSCVKWQQYSSFKTESTTTFLATFNKLRRLRKKPSFMGKRTFRQPSLHEYMTKKSALFSCHWLFFRIREKGKYLLVLSAPIFPHSLRGKLKIEGDDGSIQKKGVGLFSYNLGQTQRQCYDNRNPLLIVTT